MKKLIPIASIALLATACTADTKGDTAAIAKDSVRVATPDTVGLAQFQEWKAQNELANVAQYAPAAAAAGAVAQQSVARKERTASRSYAPARRSAAPVASSGRGNSDNSGVMANEGSRTAKKKGWSKAAKGAVIGGVTGAAAGAIVNKKNRAAGAVIGGVVGAGGGYVIGRKMDKKDGRIDLVPVNNYQY